MIPLRCFALYWRGVKCCGFVEFWRELEEKTQKKWKFAKKLVENAKFFLSSTDFPSLMCGLLCLHELDDLIDSLLNGRNIVIDFLEVMLCHLFKLLVVVRNSALL
jgi:hypothetical protein